MVDDGVSVYSFARYAWNCLLCVFECLIAGSKKVPPTWWSPAVKHTCVYQRQCAVLLHGAQPPPGGPELASGQLSAWWQLFSFHKSSSSSHNYHHRCKQITRVTELNHVDPSAVLQAHAAARAHARCTVRDECIAVVHLTSLIITSTCDAERPITGGRLNLACRTHPHNSTSPHASSQAGQPPHRCTRWRGGKHAQYARPQHTLDTQSVPTARTGFQDAADALLSGGSSSQRAFLDPPPGLPPPPFQPSEDPHDIPEDPEERQKKLTRLLREATGKWEQAREEYKKPDAVGQYIQQVIAKAGKLFQAQKVKEGLEALSSGIRKAEKELGTSSIHMTLAWDHLAMMQLVCGDLEQALESAKHAVQVAEKAAKGRFMLPVAASSMRLAVVHLSACVNFPFRDFFMQHCCVPLSLLYFCYVHAYNTCVQHPCIDTALGNKEEAKSILKKALPAMLMQTSEDFEAIGEAMFYDALIDLDKAASPDDIKATTKQLIRVCHT